jgi:hypothetical protein
MLNNLFWNIKRMKQYPDQVRDIPITLGVLIICPRSPVAVFDKTVTDKQQNLQIWSLSKIKTIN